MHPRDREDELRRTSLSEEVEYRPGGSGVTLDEEARGPSMTRGAIGSSLVAALAGWVPLLGPAAAGFVGGWLTRSRLRGIYATQIAAVICILWAWLWSYLPEIAVVPRAVADRLVPFDLVMEGASLTVVATLIVLQYVVCLLFGWIGGLANERRAGHAREDWPRPV